MKCNQICKWNSNVGCVKPYGVPCILENVSTTDRKVTNADRIRAMSDEELAELLREAYDAGIDDSTAYSWGNSKYSFIWTEEWLKQPTED